MDKIEVSDYVRSHVWLMKKSGIEASCLLKIIFLGNDMYIWKTKNSTKRGVQWKVSFLPTPCFSSHFLPQRQKLSVSWAFKRCCFIAFNRINVYLSLHANGSMLYTLFHTLLFFFNMFNNMSGNCITDAFFISWSLSFPFYDTAYHWDSRFLLV